MNASSAPPAGPATGAHVSGRAPSAVVPSPAELADARAWVAAKWEDVAPSAAGGTAPQDTAPCFSFLYGGRPSSALLPDWQTARATRDLDAHRVEHTRTWRDARTGLEVRCVGVSWKAYPTVEWTVYLRNDGSTDTPLIESLQALDTGLGAGPEGQFVLHHHLGDDCTIHSFAPRTTVLGPQAAARFAAARGRPTSEGWPYFSLECPGDGTGVIIVVGWPGQWTCGFSRDAKAGLRVQAGQELTHFRLRPGEQVRTPLIVLQFYRGDWLRAQNLWRRWMLDHNLPDDHGRPPAPRLGAASVQFCQFACTQAGDLEFIDAFLARQIPLDCWWMDAGWYPTDGEGWPKVGTWEVDRQRFPGGLRAIADRCHAHGIELLVWFEVERVVAGTWLARHHPEWIHGGAAGGLFRMDEPAAVAWLTEHVDRLLTTEGIDIYRSDFNIDPLEYWRANDAPDRQGITEIRYIEGFLGYLDELRRRHPGMLIDSCATGGRRDDLETMRRAVPLLRSDFEANPEGNQCHTYGFALWLPYYDAVHNWSPDLYRFRSSLAPFLQRNWDVRQADFDGERARALLQEWQRVAEYYAGDFHPLGDYSAADGVWLAWQFDRPDLGRGVVQAFRRAASPCLTAEYRLRGLEPDAAYVLTDADSGQTWQATGRELGESGLRLTIAARPGAALIEYRRLEAGPGADPGVRELLDPGPSRRR